MHAGVNLRNKNQPRKALPPRRSGRELPSNEIAWDAEQSCPRCQDYDVLLKGTHQVKDRDKWEL